VTLAEQLGYQHRHPNLFQRGMRRFAYTRLGAWIFSKTLRYADAALARVVEGHTVPVRP
jgi:hypothetical protein